MTIPMGSGRRAGGGTGTGDYELCPIGAQQLVCCDVVDHGIIKVPGFGNKPSTMAHKVTLRWQSEKLMADQRPYLIQRRFTLSSHSKASLRQFLEAWRGKAFTDAEAKTFDLEKLIGVNCWSNVIHRQTPRGLFAEVQTVMPPLPDRSLTIKGDYIRQRDRPLDPNAPVEDAHVDEAPPAPEEPPVPTEPKSPF